MNDQVFDLASGQERVNGWRSNVAPVPKLVVPLHLSSGHDFNKLNLPPDNRNTVPLDLEHRARVSWMLRGGDRYYVLLVKSVISFKWSRRLYWRDSPNLRIQD